MSENKPLSFQVPEPEIRPGGSPDFSGVEIPKAGVVRRPPIEADPEDIRDLAFTIIRVLSRSGDAVGCLLYTSPSPRDRQKSRMPSSA